MESAFARADSGPLSPTSAAKRSVELKRRSADPADAYSALLPPTSAPKLLCTASAKLVDLMSNFSVVDGDALADNNSNNHSGDDDGDDGEGRRVARRCAAADDDCHGNADANSAVSEQGALCPVMEEPAGCGAAGDSGAAAIRCDDDEAASAATNADAAAATATAISTDDDDAGLAAAAADAAAAAAPPAARGLAAVFDRLHARSIATAAPADVSAAIRAHLKERPAAGMDTLYVYDLAQTARMHAAWVGALPRVTPYYAVKCNPEPALLAVLEALGCGFDCASQVELATVVTRMGVDPSRVIFANPCKRPADIALARRLGVARTTFDTECELHKIAAAFPGAGCVLRLRCDDAGAQVQLGLKYGAEPHEAPRLLAAAKRLGLNVVGVSFHVGSGVRNTAVYAEAVRRARAVFDAAAAMGFTEMRLLDVGGGFVAPFAPAPAAAFVAAAGAINGALEAYFPADEWPGLQVISEPGRYFAESSATLVAPIYSTRLRTAAPDVAPAADAAPADSGDSSSDGVAADSGASDESGGLRVVRRDYWITDGLYGSFNCMLYDDQHPGFTVLRSPNLPALPASADGPGAPRHLSAVWGPTCDSADCVYRDAALPELRVGDLLVFSNAGAYTVAGACDFNGINFCDPAKLFVASRAPAPTA